MESNEAAASRRLIAAKRQKAQTTTEEARKSERPGLHGEEEMCLMVLGWRYRRRKKGLMVEERDAKQLISGKRKYTNSGGKKIK